MEMGFTFFLFFLFLSFLFFDPGVYCLLCTLFCAVPFPVCVLHCVACIGTVCVVCATFPQVRSDFLHSCDMLRHLQNNYKWKNENISGDTAMKWSQIIKYLSHIFEFKIMMKSLNIALSNIFCMFRFVLFFFIHYW